MFIATAKTSLQTDDCANAFKNRPFKRCYTSI